MTLRLFIYDNFVLNVDNDVDAERLLSDPKTVRELTPEEIEETFGEHANHACLKNTGITEDGAIKFTFDEIEHLKILGDTIRAERNQRLKACDWTVLPDVPVSQPWMDYRQALRDVPSQPGFPTVVWPEEPT